MVEVMITYDLLPRINDEAYADWSKRAIVSLLKSPGVVEMRAYRNLMGSPHVLLVTVWETLADWARFAEDGDWTILMDELRDAMGTGIDVQVWGQSPMAPEPLRPPKSN